MATGNISSVFFSCSKRGLLPDPPAPPVFEAIFCLRTIGIGLRAAAEAVR